MKTHQIWQSKQVALAFVSDSPNRLMSRHPTLQFQHDTKVDVRQLEDGTKGIPDLGHWHLLLFEARHVILICIHSVLQASVLLNPSATCIKKELNPNLIHFRTCIYITKSIYRFFMLGQTWQCSPSWRILYQGHLLDPREHWGHHHHSRSSPLGSCLVALVPLVLPLITGTTCNEHLVDILP